MTRSSSRNLVVDIAPLWELQYTGISNVVCEMAARALNASRSDFEFSFSAFEHIVDQNVIRACVENQNGAELRSCFQHQQALPIDEHLNRVGNNNIGLFLHVKPAKKRFKKEAHLYYDLSYLSVPETHAQETVDFHRHNLFSQISTTDQFFAISESTALDLNWHFNVPMEKIKVTYLGHNTDVQLSDEFRVNFFDRKIESYFLCLGTIEPRKNIPLILNWISGNIEVLKSCRFVFCGREGWGPSFAQLIASVGLEWAVDAGRIVHYGYVSQRQKAALLAGAEALLFPSLFEGFGLPVLEAMAQSVPVIASCSTSIPEVLGEDGIYFDPYSTASLSIAFAQFLREKRSGELVKKTERLRCRSETFTYDSMFDEIMNSLTLL